MKTRIALAAFLVLAVSLTGCMGDSVAPNDTTAPAAPQGVTAASADLNWNLAWQTNTEPDVAGYYVYRTPITGTQQGTAQQLTTEAVASTQYQIPAESGQWQYVVRAVDTAGNVSAPSTPVLVTMGSSGGPLDPNEGVVARVR
jgi:hypothetical protein